MNNGYNLERFIKAQESDYEIAFNEIKKGRKISHWMWYIFPQIKGLGFSDTARFYGIENLEEAELYLKHAVLGKRLIDIAAVLLELEGKTAYQIFGSPDDLKLKSCMSLFAAADNTAQVFNLVLKKYFQGEQDSKTLKIINKLEIK